MSQELIEKIADAIGALRFPVSNDSNRHFARAAIAAIEGAGYRIVPVEPTERMKDAMWLRLPRLRQATSEELRHALKDSIAAAPKVIP